MNILLDVAAGPMFAVVGVIFVGIGAAVAAIVCLAVWLIKKAIKNNKGE